uniref:Ig-like domain-containing protein n=1 Tax=Pelodiscus sinensis TaxID=13735 RepID=K7GDV0_PELSI
SFPKPSISLHPSRRVTLGAATAVRCQGSYWNAQYQLYKDGNPTAMGFAEPAGHVAEFPFPSVSQADAGSYHCRFRNKWYRPTWSHPSDPVELVVAGEGPGSDPSLPRPSISLSPTGVTPPGANVTIRCQGPGRDVRFFLHQGGDLNQPLPMEPPGDEAEFHIRPAGRQHGGNYSCSYRLRSEPFISSAPSDPVELVVADYTWSNIVRLALSSGVLLAVVLILAEAAH